MYPRRTRREFLASATAAGTVAAAGCLDLGDGEEPSPVESPYDLAVDHDVETWAHYDPDWTPPETSPTDAEFRTETLIENLEIPWDMSFADDGELYFSERIGRISRYDAGEIEAVTEADDVIDHATAVSPDAEGQDWWGGGSEGGLLGISLHPNYPDVPVLYAYYTYRKTDEEYRNRLVYYDLENDNEETVVIDEIPGHRLIHNGARLAFGPRNYLWVTTGDAGEGSPAQDGTFAQDPGRLAGKVLRTQPDGTAPAEHPGLEDPRVHTYGHRNPQAVSWLPDATPIAAEHGPTGGGDEVNVIEAGGNYGWSEVRSGPGEYDPYAEHDDVTPPVVNTGGETWAPPGGVFYTGDDVPALRNRFVLGGLVSQRLNVVSVYEGSAPDIGGTRYDAGWMHPEYEAVAHPLLTDVLGRIRHVEQGPNGELYAVTSNRDGRSSEPEEDAFPTAGDDRLVRIVAE